MKLNKMTAVLLAATMLGGVATPALAASKKSRDSELRAMVERQQKQIDALNAQIQAMQANAVPVVGALAGGVAADAAAAEENASNIEFMQVTIESQQAQIDALKKTTATNAPNWKGAPELKSGTGFSWKPNGVIQYDAGYVSNPNNKINTANLGWNSNFRRLLFGVEGTVPGDFKYKFQFDVAGGSLGFEDVLIAYEPAGKPYSLQVGYFYPFTSLDNMTSNRFISMMERSQLNDAFGSGRRIGVAGAYQTSEFLLQAGLMNGTTVNAATGNTAWSADARAVWFPKFGTAQYHAAVGYHNRHNNKNSLGQNYQARPFTTLTSIRFVGTSPATTTGASGTGIAAYGDQILAAELAGIWGSFNAVAEAQLVKVDAVNPTDVLSGGQAASGFTRLAQDPTFFSAYGEVGYWFTGESRGYKAGKWDRTKIVNPFDKGGWGGFQLVGRVDYLNLTQYVGASTPTSSLVTGGTLNGGSQLGYLVALNWWPTDYVRFTSQFIRSDITGGPSAAAVDPTSLLTPVYDRNYSVNAFVMRAQLDF